MRKIMVAIPNSRGSYAREFMESYTHSKNWLMAHAETIPFDFGIMEYYCHTFPIDANRNECISVALDRGFDQIIFLDTDQEFPRETLYKLISSDLPIVAGIYHAKVEPYYPIIFRESKDSVNFNLFDPIMVFPDNEPFYADMIGMGCVAIKREVLEKLERPYFKYQPHPAQLADNNPYSKLKVKFEVNDVSEDVWFWKQVKDKTDYRIVIDPKIDVQHLSSIKIGRGMWKSYINAAENAMAEAKGIDFVNKKRKEKCQAELIKKVS